MQLLKNNISLTASILSVKNWNDLVQLFGEKGACGGCWCMTPRLPSGEYNKNKGEGNKQRLHQLLMDNESLGVLAYDKKEPVAWCSISPKSRLMQMKNSKLMKHTTDADTWSIVCLFIKKEYRQKGVSTFIIKKAVDYAFKNGAKIVEAYPVVPKNDKMPDVFAWTGIWKSYEKAGFKKVLEVSESRWIMAVSH